MTAAGPGNAWAEQGAGTNSGKGAGDRGSLETPAHQSSQTGDGEGLPLPTREPKGTLGDGGGAEYNALLCVHSHRQGNADHTGPCLGFSSPDLLFLKGREEKC